MTIPHARRKHTAAIGSLQPKTTSVSDPVPFGIAPTDNELRDVLSTSSDDGELTVRDMWIYRWGVFGCVCLAGVAIVLVTYRLTLTRWESEGSTTASSIAQTGTMLPTASPTPSPIVLDRAKIKVHIVNATGVAGRARALMDTLVKQGYTDNGVETGAEILSRSVLYTPQDVQESISIIRQDIGLGIDIEHMDTQIHEEKNMITIILGTQ